MVSVNPADFERIFSALITPTREDESVNYDAWRRSFACRFRTVPRAFTAAGPPARVCCSP